MTASVQQFPNLPGPSRVPDRSRKRSILHVPQALLQPEFLAKVILLTLSMPSKRLTILSYLLPTSRYDRSMTFGEYVRQRLIPSGQEDLREDQAVGARVARGIRAARRPNRRCC